MGDKIRRKSVDPARPSALRITSHGACNEMWDTEAYQHQKSPPHNASQVMWCHTGGCGLSFTRLKSDLPPAARTCHYCTDVPDHDGLRLHCGGSTKGMKIRRHAFHVACWKDAIRKSNLDDVARRAILVHPREFLSHCGLSFDAISPEEQEYVLQRWNDDSTTP